MSTRKPEPEVDPAKSARERLQYCAELERALTRDVLRMARAYAARRCAVLQRLGVSRDAEELVADAISDTFEQRRPWKYKERTLSRHLERLIKSKTSDLIEHAFRFRHVSLDAARDADDGGARLESLTSTLIDEPERRTIRQDAAEQFVAALQEAAQARNDRIVIGLVEAYRQGITKRHQVAEHLGIRPKQYDHARDRLARLISKLPEELTADAVEVMRRWA